MADGERWRRTLRYPGGEQDNPMNSRTMLRFRPILPKPTAQGALSVGLAVTHQNGIVSERKAKRNYVRVRRNSGYKRKNNYKSTEQLEKRDRSQSPELKNAAVVTPQLLPEQAEPEQGSLAGVSWCKNVDLDQLVENRIQILDNREPPSATENSVVVETWVTVESVTDTCMEAEGLAGRTDVEKVKSLESDTCPGFISDGYLRVRWVNDAYKKMVTSEECCCEGQTSPEIVVWLKVKDNVVWCYSHAAFTCGVRLQYRWWKEKCTKMVPCDVWRLESGGLAWRLDVKAALSLGL